ncbi:TetR/AcrR family transcriptional regulator [Nonomuraea antimicrobica]
MTRMASQRRQREKAQLRERLLGAAREIAVEEGWQAVTIRRIADRLEYTSPILYQHFSGKDALLWELTEMGFREIAERIEQALSKEGGSDAVTTIAGAYWDFAFAAPELYHVMHGLDGVPFGTAETPADAQRTFALCRDAVVRQAAAQGYAITDPDAIVETIWAYLHGFVTLTMGKRLVGDRERARDLMLRSLPALSIGGPHATRPGTVGEP